MWLVIDSHIFKMSKNTCDNKKKDIEVPVSDKKIEYASKVKANNTTKPKSTKPLATTTTHVTTSKNTVIISKEVNVESKDNTDDISKINESKDDNKEEVKSPGKRSFIEAPVPSTNAWKSKHSERYLKLSSKPQKIHNKPGWYLLIIGIYLMRKSLK